MKQEIVVSSNEDWFREKCDELLDQDYTVVPGSVAVSSRTSTRLGEGIFVAFFDPPTGTYTRPGEQD